MPLSPRADIRWRDATAVFCATLAYLYLFAGVLSRIGDEGVLVNGAALTAAGAVPYRDFADLVNPLSYYWLAAWFTVFGTTFAVSRVLLVLTGAASVTLVLWLTARAYGARAGRIAALVSAVVSIPFWPGTNHHWDSNLFVLMTLGALALWQSTQRQVFALLVGLGAAATSGFMIEKGGLVLLAALGVMWLDRAADRLRVAWGMVSGFSAGIGLLCLAFVWLGAAWDFLYVNVLFPAMQYEGTRRLPYAFYLSPLAWDLPLPITISAFGPRIGQIVATIMAVPLIVVALAPIIGAARIIGWAWQRQWPLNQAQRLLWLGAVALALSEMHRWDVFHLIYGSPLLLGALFGETLAGGTAWSRRAAGALVVCTVVLGLWQGAVARSAQTYQDTRRGVIRTHERNEALEFLINNSRSGEAVFVYPYYPMYYFLADVRNPTRYGILMYGYNTPDQFREALADLDRAKPRFVLWDTLIDGEHWSRWYPSYVPPADRDLIIEPYLTKHYRVIANKSGFRIMQRVEASAPFTNSVP